ncbi:acyl-CoA reductase-like NAD-dependent aldehyde dehydrogenase [Actinoplanes campanulatus]|uniref:Acyl-CoA reductase-like NAD-dependent aldehyde dehydrogenase n=1 Tax=Actinoplanes campanulatus TaxID=113559 RepID=A0A7W5AFF6_9ACTN|nr:aldehyde dehydrogenase family protein [Actinoplanes campanulatus]MBB3095238.1 acyl-CoA reductase-like NAD-dependent aldehyde dehydrogenase [Actinoplanes campanulatus]GGN24355.1 aldehyde dehydrogenase [Actinoplanes campanulatus]GID34843.1 aldehyde dehydrogenase [Actinoplanes campanulatus]
MTASAAATIERENPARTAEIVGVVAETAPEAVDAIVREADADQRRWAARPLADRLAALARAAAAIEDATPGLATLLARESGKVAGDCRGELGFAVRYLRWVVEHAPEAYADRVLDDDLGRVVEQRKPYGVVAAVTPWNAPVILAMLKIAPALAAGNAIVVKPSPLAPLTVSRVVDLFDAPVRVVHGGAETGAALVGHDLVRKVAFTGGAAGGRAVAALAGDRLTPSVLELGGNDPAVFLDDAPFTDDAMDRLVMASFATGGQVCMAAKRLYVPSSRLSAFVGAYLAAADRVLVTGDPLGDRTTTGPLISAAAQRMALALRGTAADAAPRPGTHSGRLAWGGVVHDLGQFEGDPATGYFVRPALVVEPDPGSPLVVAEQFAPVVPVLGYSDEESVLAAANAGELGLGASVWSADEERAFAFARRFEAGFTFVNTHNRTGMSLRAPFGGVKRSGWGREYAHEGLAEYVQTCVIHAPAAFRPGAAVTGGGPSAYPAG